MSFKRTSMALFLVISVVGCSNQQIKDGDTVEKSNQKQVNYRGDIVGVPAVNSKFSKLEIGMSSKKVTDLIGLWTDHNIYQTGKAWIPFYFGRDIVRKEFLYKDEGRLTFGGNDRLIKIIVDVTEDGYK